MSDQNLQPTCNQLATDTISRQAAQTELMMKCERYTLARESHGMGHVEWSSDLISVADAMDAIRDLPSAKPEIIRCKDCKHRHLDGMIWNCPFGLSGGEDFFCAYGAKGGDEE